MDTFIPGFIIGLREGLEAFLIIGIILQYLNRSGNSRLSRSVYYGASAGVVGSLAIGGILYLISGTIERMELASKLWESLSSFVALILITTFIVWMIRHGRSLVSEIHGKVGANLSAVGIFAISMMMVAREGAEVAIFTFAGEYQLVAVLSGVVVALIFSVLINKSLIKVNIGTIFTITLAYLILQAGFLLGYGVHEGLSSLKASGIIQSDSMLLVKAFDLSNTVLSHKEGFLGLPMMVAFGWYSKPEVLQFILQYAYTAIAFIYWIRISNRKPSILSTRK